MNTVKFQAKKYNSNTDLELDPVPELTSPAWTIDVTDETGARDGVDSQRYNTNMDPELDQDPELNPMFWSETQIRLEPEMECSQN